MRNLPPGSGNAEPDARTADPRPRRRPHPRALQEPRHDLQPAALDALPRRRTTSRAPTAPTCPGVSGGDGDVKPGKTWTYRLTAGLRLGRRVALPRPLALDARVDRRRDVGDALDPRPPRAAARPRVRRRVRADRATSRRSTAARSSATRPCSPPSPGQLVQWDVMAMGSEHHTFHVHGHRWREHGGADVDTQTVGPGGELPHPLARARPRHVALPLPRRDPHGAGHDRHLPGVRVGRTSKWAPPVAPLLRNSSVGAKPLLNPNGVFP